MSFFITFFISRSFSVCLYPWITNPSQFEFFVQVRSREYIDCSQVKGQLTVPGNCITIGDESFCNCTGLYGNLVFENRMERIGKNAFLNTNFLRVIYKGSDVPNCTQEAFPDNLPIYVSSSYESNKLCGRDVQVEDLDQLLQESIIELTDPPTPVMTEPPTIPSSESSSEITSEMTLPISSEEETTQIITEIITSEPLPVSTEKPTESPTNICKHIDINDTQQLNLPLLEIEKNEFAFCSQIKGKLELPQSLTSIGSSAFYQCSGLTDSLEIPKKVETVDDNAFDGCSGLNGYLVINSEIKRIGKGAFNSTNFSKILYNGKFEPSCGEKPFPDGQIIHITQNYQNDTFCGYQIEMDISENSNSIDNSKSEFIESTFEFIQTDSIQNSEEADKMTSFSIMISEFESDSDQITSEPQITEKSKKKKKLSSGAVVAIVIACVVFMIAVVALLIYFCSIRGKNPLEEQLTSNTLTDIHDVN